MSTHLSPLYPGIIQRVLSTQPVDSLTARDLAIISTIVSFSSLTPRAKFLDHDKHLHTCDLFAAVILPAGTGKSVIKIANILLRRLHKRAIDKYNMEVANMQFPKPQTVILPTDISKARLFEHFEGQGKELPMVLVETEMDSLTKSIMSTHGGFRAELRKVYHHEPISYSKKTKSELAYVDKPRLSMLISGTKEQAKRFFNPMEDGFYSRFLIYYRDIKPNWIDYHTGNQVFPEHEIERLAEDYYSFYARRDVMIDLSKGYDMLNNIGRDLSEEQHENGTQDFDLVSRHGVMFLRILGVLTCMRSFDDGDLSETIEPMEQHLSLARELTLMSAQMSMDLRSVISFQATGKGSNNGDFHSLPESFQISELVNVPGWRAYSIRTIQRKIKNYVRDGLLEKVGKDYIKT